jgi:hypothetical protein
MPVAFRPLRPGIAAEVDGIDMSRLQSAADVAAIHAGMDKYAALAIHQ